LSLSSFITKIIGLLEILLQAEYLCVLELYSLVVECYFSDSIPANDFSRIYQHYLPSLTVHQRWLYILRIILKWLWVFFFNISHVILHNLNLKNIWLADHGKNVKLQFIDRWHLFFWNTSFIYLISLFVHPSMILFYY